MRGEERSRRVGRVRRRGRGWGIACRIDCPFWCGVMVDAKVGWEGRCYGRREC